MNAMQQVMTVLRLKGRIKGSNRSKRTGTNIHSVCKRTRCCLSKKIQYLHGKKGEGAFFEVESELAHVVMRLSEIGSAVSSVVEHKLCNVGKLQTT